MKQISNRKKKNSNKRLKPQPPCLGFSRGEQFRFLVCF